MNRNTGLTALLTIEIAAVFVMGILTAFKWSDARKFADDNAALQERLTAVQKRLDEVQTRLAASEDSLDGCQQDLVDQGITANARLLDCQKATAENIRRHCGSLCASCYVLVRDVEEDLTGILNKQWRVSAEKAP
jgi:hypothetical protein